MVGSRLNYLILKWNNWTWKWTTEKFNQLIFKGLWKKSVAFLDSISAVSNYWEKKTANAGLV